MDPEPGIAEDAREGWRCVAVLWRPRFLPAPACARTRQQPQHTQRDENGPPAQRVGDQRAEDGAECRHECQHRGEQTVERGTLGRIGIHIAHRSEGGDQCGRRTDRLHAAPGQEPRTTTTRGERERRQREQQRAHQQHRPSPDPVRQWAEDQLTQPEY
ncbi:hypothetical protein D3C72_990720 [compost metagenome]